MSFGEYQVHVQETLTPPVDLSSLGITKYVLRAEMHVSCPETPVSEPIATADHC